MSSRSTVTPSIATQPSAVHDPAGTNRKGERKLHLRVGILGIL